MSKAVCFEHVHLSAVTEAPSPYLKPLCEVARYILTLIIPQLDEERIYFSRWLDVVPWVEEHIKAIETFSFLSVNFDPGDSSNLDMHWYHFIDYGPQRLLVQQ